MGYIRTKTIKGKQYQYEQESYRDTDGKVKTRHIQYLGKFHISKSGEEMITKSKKIFGITTNPKEAGWVLPDGEMLDFSGRHEAVGYKRKNKQFISDGTQGDYLKGDRNTDHREIQRAMKNKAIDRSIAMNRFAKQTRSIRVHGAAKNDIYVEIFRKPTKQQMDRLNRMSSGNRIYVDYFDRERSIREAGKSDGDYKSFYHFEKDIEKIYGKLKS